MEELDNVATVDFREDALNLHNQYCQKHSAEPLALSSELNAVAQQWVENMADSDEMKHSCGQYGENLFGCSGNRSISDSEAVVLATTSWYNQISDFDFEVRIHRVRDTSRNWCGKIRSLGIGVGRRDRGVFVCANYDPSGNYMDQFIQNVSKE